jgi:phosphoribosyl-ATP pyrophosphohydrolase/phosphoribosyl-AMP cyclohydrolase
MSDVTVDLDLDTLDFEKGSGLVTVVAQDATTGAVLMVAHADRDALVRTIESGEMHYTSRTRGLWHKGATSGNRQRVVSLTRDCDGDAVLARVIPLGPACHDGGQSCFDDLALMADAVAVLDGTVASRRAAMAGAGAAASYTQRLLGDRNLRLKKLGEEMAEFVTACADDAPARAVEEAADLVYHIIVALRGVGADWGRVRMELAARGLKAARK